MLESQAARHRRSAPSPLEGRGVGRGVRAHIWRRKLPPSRPRCARSTSPSRGEVTRGAARDNSNARPRARRRAGAPHGRRRQAADANRRRHHPRRACSRGCRPQCARIILNANGDPARFADTGLPVIADDVPDFAGPLAGILAGLDWAAANAPDIAYVVSVPGDCPFLPRDLVARLHQARAAAGLPLACARSGEWRHPVVGLWPVALRDDLRHALTRGRPAQDRGLDRAPWRRIGRLAGRAGRSVLQRQHAGGCRRGRAHCGAASRRMNP